MPFLPHSFSEGAAMNLSTIFYFLLSSLLVAALPCPAMMLVLQAAINGGRRAGLMVTLGILGGDALLVFIGADGLHQLFT